MTITVPNLGEAEVLNKFLNQTLTLKLFSNDITPSDTDAVGDYTECAGGGYVSKSLTFGNWVVVAGDPAQATYPVQSFNFTGPTDAPSVLYGYYVVDASNVLLWSERFAAGVVPFTPVNGTLIQVTPVFDVS